jgi:acetyltransferase-like isoleucine patch superfamily enzyme
MIRKIANRIVHDVFKWAEDHSNAHERSELVARLKRFGRGSTFGGSIRVIGPENVDIGNNVHIGRGAWIRGDGGLTIGDNTHISRNVVIYTANHNINGSRLPYDETLVCRTVSIGPNVWIGMNVCICPGSTIGEGAVVGLGTVVSGEIPPLAIVVGSKSRVVSSRDAADYEQKKRAGLFGGQAGHPVGQ